MQAATLLGSSLQFGRVTDSTVVAVCAVGFALTYVADIVAVVGLWLS